MEATKNPNSLLAHARTADIVMLAVLAAAVLVGLGCDMSDQPAYEKYKGWLLAVAGIVFLYITIPVLIRCGRGGVKSVWPVLGASGILLAVTLGVFYTAYYWIVAALPAGGPPPSDKVLNFPPVIAALWAAGMGWYVHYQASTKNHRTTNSFNLIMQTRTSREFLDRSLLVQLSYPHGCEVPREDEEFFKASMLKNLTAREQEQTAEFGKVEVELQEQLRKARGADGLKYLLNYYEFMAVGIKAKDLEEELLYETIGVTVTSVFNRSKTFIDFCRRSDGGNQPLAFETLDELATVWNARLKEEIHTKR